jgi:predicted metal-binding protein
MLETKRLVIGQMIVCHGCCCGATQKNRPEVPVEWLKDEWRKRGLLKRFQLTMSSCVGPCDVPNVVVVNSETGSQWLGNITHFDQYWPLLEWAARSVEAGYVMELPARFQGPSIGTMALII